MVKNSTVSWGSISRAFHWIVGAMIVGMLAYGWWMNHMAPRPDRLFHRSIHADIGYVVLLLMVLRLLWRAINPTPALPSGTPRWARALDHLTQGALYLVTIGGALLGWAHAGAHNPDYASWFGLFRVPQLMSEDRANARFFEQWHIYFAYVLMAMIALHVAAALYHHLFKRDRILLRMVDGK